MGYILLLVWAIRLLVEGHKEPVAATIANNEDDDDDDDDDYADDYDYDDVDCNDDYDFDDNGDDDTRQYEARKGRLAWLKLFKTFPLFTKLVLTSRPK